MRHDFSKVFAVGVCAACFKEEISEEHRDYNIAKNGEIVLSIVLDIACIERRFHEWLFLSEIVGEDDIRHE